MFNPLMFEEHRDTRTCTKLYVIVQILLSHITRTGQVFQLISLKSLPKYG